MAQDYIKINGITIKQPDQDGYTALLSTTSTEDSDRDMALVMHNTPVGTVEGYNLKWSYPTLTEAAQILQQVVNKPSFVLHYCDIYTGQWKDGLFYAAEYNAPCKCLKNGEECWAELSFDVRSINPL